MEDELLEAKKKAMSLLEYADRTEWQLRDKLMAKGFSEEAVDGAVEYVKSFHYIDDLRYAIHFVETHHAQRSIMRLRQDLSQRHVSEEYIDIALEGIEEGDGMALRAAIQKLTKGKSDFSYEEKQKMAGKLYRKGFRVNDIKRELEL